MRAYTSYEMHKGSRILKHLQTKKCQEYIRTNPFKKKNRCLVGSKNILIDDM